jgi:type IV pilus assembly protein PilP
MKRAFAILGVALLFAGCGDDAAPKPKAPPPKAARPPAAVAALAPPPPASREALLDEVRKRPLSNDDFTESENNRDPFRSYLETFAVQPPVLGKQHKIILQKFSLDELKLVAIVSGDSVAPRAMFVDPSGMGVNVMRGDHVSKADATVERIAPDRVLFQIEEDAGSGKVRMVERVIELHAGEVVTQ